MIAEPNCQQTSSHILMIRPSAFHANEQTLDSNAFQKPDPTERTDINVSAIALSEFEALASALKAAEVDVIVMDDRPDLLTPDSVFPNNWVSFHEEGSVFLYPMHAENRRLERRSDILELLELNGFYIKRTIDLSSFEPQGKFLEGTGSMVLDRVNKIAYACLSPRTHQEVLAQFCLQSGYRFLLFKANDLHDKAIYHTNVMMCIGTHFTLVCLESLSDENEKVSLLKQLNQSGRELITISLSQMNQFAGNMLELRSRKGEALLIMSSQAFQTLSDTQKANLSRHCRLIHSPLFTIEKNGGGSARCMLAEIHLPYQT